MDEKRKILLARVLEMNEVELRAALLTILNGMSPENAIDAAYNPFTRKRAKGSHPITAVLGDE